jgi:hypothetical protein
MDALLVVSADGARELRANGAFDRVHAATVLLADDTVELPDLPCAVDTYPFRQQAGVKLAALGAIVAWLARTGAFPLDALWAVAEAGLPDAAASMRATLAPFRHPP